MREFRYFQKLQSTYQRQECQAPLVETNNDIDAAIRIIEGSARNMGIDVID